MDGRLGNNIDLVLRFLSVMIACDYVGECHSFWQMRAQYLSVKGHAVCNSLSYNATIIDIYILK